MPRSPGEVPPEGPSEAQGAGPPWRRPVRPAPGAMHLEGAPQLRAEPEDWLGGPHEGRPPWLVPAALAALFVLLIIGAYVAGRLFATTLSDLDVPVAVPGPGVEDVGQGPAPVRPGPGGASPTADPTDEADGGADRPGADATSRPKPYRGPIRPAAISAAAASCQAPASQDAAGNPVGYGPRNAIDEDPRTAWRCRGRGVGQTLTLTVPRGTRVGSVGLIPGYAKTDATTGADRYAENNRITRVRWTFDDGSTVKQKLDPAPRKRKLQTKAIAPVVTRTIVLEVRASAPGSRNTIAVSEILVGVVDG